MGRGRPPKPGTAEEKAAARRERVRNNVRALRERRKQEALTGSNLTTGDPFRLEWIENDYARVSSKRRQKNPESEDEPSSQASSTPDTASPSSTHSGTLYLVNQRTAAKTLVPPNVDSKNSYAFAMLATVRVMFLPDAIYLPTNNTSSTARPWDSKQLLWTPCAFWVTSAFSKASNQETSVLKTTLLSIGMLLKGVEHGDRSLQVAAMEMYRRSLQGIRKTLDPIIQGRPEKPKDTVALYLACHAAAMFELIQNADLSATMRHLRGVSQLICHLGDGSSEEGQSMAWLLLQDYRFAEMGLCMKYRYVSYSSIARRKFEKDNINAQSSESYSTSARGRRSHNMLVILTDIADDISAIMVQIDLLKLKLPKYNIAPGLRRFLEKLDEIWQRFPDLHNQLIQRYGNAFIHKDEDEDISAEGSYRFKTFDIGAAWCYNLMTQLYCLETSIEVTTLLLKVERDVNSNASSSSYGESPLSEGTEVNSVDDFANLDRLHELRRLHRAICIQLTRCLMYFLQTDKGITGQALAIYPLDAALNMLNVEMKRLQVDLAQARLARKGKEHATMVWKDLVSIGNAKTFVQKMQERAKQFGLPSFHEAAPHEVIVDEPLIFDDLD